MANVSELLEVRLKPTDKGAKRDRSSPNIQLASKDSKEREETRRKEFFDSGFDRWYDLVKDKTIPSQLVEIKPLEAKAIVLCWKRDFQHKEHGSAILSEARIQLPADLNDLIDRLSSTITSFPSGNGAFVKLSTRSPKDSLFAFENAHKAYQTRLDSLGEKPSVNDKLNLLSTVVGESLKVTTGEEAVKLLISSDRVGEDLEYALEKGDEEFITFIHLVVREWVSVPQWAEFRGFVSDGQLTALGQYNYLVRFPVLKDKVSRIKDDLEKFHASIQERVKMERYIIDFVWTEENIYLIEFNAFSEERMFPTTTGLWDWESPADRQQIMKGPLKLRIRDCDADPKLIHPKWRAIIM